MDKLVRSFDLNFVFNDVDMIITVNKDKYLNANDMVKHFPGKRISDWAENKSVKEFISLLENDLNTADQRELKEGEIVKFQKAIITKKGRHGSGTWLHPDLAMEFAMWLSPEFKLHVIRKYRQTLQEEELWSIKRIDAAKTTRILTDSVKRNIVDKTGDKMAYPEEMNLINRVIMGRNANGTNLRNITDNTEIDAFKVLQIIDSVYIDEGKSQSEREKLLRERYLKDF